ncbi:TatD related DNase [Prunus dulcis]|uniref:TatD related DNase n=1 Tax=Prunus dulcis TaxID=3755 RepID=A0A4Y1QXX2_PRUDU|nr:TatD related DNase [Prunus dulcis]
MGFSKVLFTLTNVACVAHMTNLTENYVMDLLANAGMLDCKPVVENRKLGVYVDQISTNKERYQRRSKLGHFTFVGGNLVMWHSKKQHVVSRSSTEFEYRGIAQGVQHDRTNHVEVDRHFIKEKLEHKDILVDLGLDGDIEANYDLLI